MHLSRSFVVRFAIVLVLLASASDVGARTLTLEDRVRAQEQIERVYYGHQIQATRAFDQAVPREFLVRKVRDYLKRSAALEKVWGTRVTADALQAEMERIGRGTRYPERVQEIYRALGNDPTLIRECFARPALVDRLSRSFFDRDDLIHASARREAETLRERLWNGHMSPRLTHPRRAMVEARKGDPRDAGSLPGNAREAASPLVLSHDEFETWRARAPGQVGAIGPVVDERDAFVVRVVLDETRDRSRVAVYSVPKVRWEEWWEKTARDLEIPESEVAADDRPVPLPRRHAASTRSSAPCDADDTWDNGILDDYPGQTSDNATAVWTGNLMLVWGSAGNQALGGRYDPLTDSWEEITPIGAPGAPQGTTTVWTGDAMLVWGWEFGTNQITAARYDPVADQWSPISLIDAPSGRFGHSAVWTGQVMVIWGGRDLSNVLNTGARYNPAQDRWEATSTSFAPSPRYGHTATWAGTRMLVWGGRDFATPSGLVSGAVYYPGIDHWGIIPTTGAPSARTDHVAVWTGDRLIVWGGVTPGVNEPGGRFDPATDEWQPMSAQSQPWSVGEKTAVWTGDRMLVWGGNNSGNNPGGRYDPDTNTWASITTVNAPVPKDWHPAVWTGMQMIVWAGSSPDTGGYAQTGGRYDPTANAWTPVSRGLGPSYRFWHATVWTGNVMVVWGGTDGTSNFASGGRYDPLTDSWTPTTMFNAPEPAQLPSAVWAGQFMVVSGWRYDPILDTWMRASVSLGDPGCAVWTGSRILTGGSQYDPGTDTSTPMSSVGRPPCSLFFSQAVWTGTEMIVWGSAGPPSWQRTGGRYNPATNTWGGVATLDAPVGRRNHTAVWAGNRMVVWGGYNGTDLNNGGRYDPVGGTWAPMSTVNAPSSGSYPTSIWTGSRAIVWGGTPGGQNSAGGRYDPSLDIWTPTTSTNAPLRRHWHTSVWTGSFMIVWDGQTAYGTGGRYALGHSIDNDGDGYSECMGDCNDGNPAVHPATLEICDGRDNNCDGQSDETFGDADGDLMGDACDCAPGDASSFAVPGEVREVDWPTAVQLRWRTQADSAGSGTVYDVVKGRIGEWPVGSGASEVCLESGSADTTSGDPSAPGVRSYYLVRARNACGTGIYGRTSSGTEQITPACP